MQYNSIAINRAWALIPDMRSIVTAAQLAERHGVTERTIYRDIRYLRSQGVRIASGNGVGYMLRAVQPCCRNCGAPLTAPAQHGSMAYMAQEVT